MCTLGAATATAATATTATTATTAASTTTTVATAAGALLVSEQETRCSSHLVDRDRERAKQRRKAGGEITVSTRGSVSGLSVTTGIPTY